MKFDTTIIGGGLAGLICGIKLVNAGKKCAIISSGQSALHFSSGSFDLLNKLEDGTPVNNPLEGISKLTEINPNHPYAKLGGESSVVKFANEAQSILGLAGIKTKGDLEKNHCRVTPMGTLKRTWLTIEGLLTCPLDNSPEYKNILLCNFEGFLDFYPHFIASEFEKSGIKSQLTTISLSSLETLRKNPSELRSTNIARLLNKADVLSELSEILREAGKNCDAVILPACIEFNNSGNIQKISEAISKPVRMIATFPPSVPGISAQLALTKYFKDKGGVFMLGDNVKKIDIESSHSIKTYTSNHVDIPILSQNTILATGSFFSQGLIASRDRIFEPIMNLDVDYTATRKDWYTEGFYAKQNYQSFGLKTNENFQAIKEGKVIENLYVAGAILGGYSPLKEGSGSGVAMLSSLKIAEEIIKA